MNDDINIYWNEVSQQTDWDRCCLLSWIHQRTDSIYVCACVFISNRIEETFLTVLFFFSLSLWLARSPSPPDLSSAVVNDVYIIFTKLFYLVLACSLRRSKCSFAVDLVRFFYLNLLSPSLMCTQNTHKHICIEFSTKTKAIHVKNRSSSNNSSSNIGALIGLLARSQQAII